MIKHSRHHRAIPSGHARQCARDGAGALEHPQRGTCTIAPASALAMLCDGLGDMAMFPEAWREITRGLEGSALPPAPCCGKPSTSISATAAGAQPALQGSSGAPAMDVAMDANHMLLFPASRPHVAFSSTRCICPRASPISFLQWAIHACTCDAPLLLQGSGDATNGVSRDHLRRP